MRESEVKLAATEYLLSGTAYDYNVAKLRVPGLSSGRGGNQADAVDLAVYLGRWLVGAVECKSSWTVDRSNGWSLIYNAIGQLMIHGRAGTMLGQHADVNLDAYLTLSRVWRRQKLVVPDLPLAAVVGSHLDESHSPRLNKKQGVEAFVRARLRALGVDLILCWQEGDKFYLDPHGRSTFLKHVDAYTSEVERAMANFERSCEATVSLLSRITAGSYAPLVDDNRAATFAIDIGTSCYIFYPYESPRNQDWDVAKLQALAEDCGGDAVLDRIISHAKNLSAHARRRRCFNREG